MTGSAPLVQNPESLAELEAAGPDLHEFLTAQFTEYGAFAKDPACEQLLPQLTSQAIHRIKESGDDVWLSQESEAANTATPNLRRFTNYMVAGYLSGDPEVVRTFGGYGKNAEAFTVGTYLALALMRAYSAATGTPLADVNYQPDERLTHDSEHMQHLRQTYHAMFGYDTPPPRPKTIAEAICEQVGSNGSSSHAEVTQFGLKYMLTQIAVANSDLCRVLSAPFTQATP